MRLAAEMLQASKSDSCITDISSRPNVAKDRVIINVGGYRHETYLSTLKVVPDSRLAWIAENASKQAEYDPENNEYFFDRHPSVFVSILNYYRTGKLHCPSEVCGPLFEEELAFWGIDELQMEPCCWSNYTQHRDAQATLKAFEGLQKDSGDSEPDNSNIFVDPNGPRLENFKKQTWAMLELPYSSKYAQIYAFVSLLVIVLSVATFCVESMDTKKKYKIVFDSLEYFYCIVFTLELVARFATCPNRVKFFKEAMTWVDILSIMPLYIRFAEPDTKLDFLFVLRLVRIFRLFRFFRTMSGMQVIGHTLRASARELFLLVLILLIPMVIFSTLVFYAEQSTEALTEATENEFRNIPESFWWAVITMTTVGYGDVTPKTHLGRAIGTVCACVGVLIVALPVSVIGSNFTLFYSHAQAQLKLPKKKKKPVLLGAAGVLVSETSIYGNEESSEPPALPSEVTLSFQRRSMRNPSIIPRKVGSIRRTSALDQQEAPPLSPPPLSPSPVPTPVNTHSFATSLIPADSIELSESDPSIKPVSEAQNSNRELFSAGSSETCISNGLKGVGDSMVHLTTHIHRRMAISPHPTPPLRRPSQKRKKKTGNKKPAQPQEEANLGASDKALDGEYTTDVDSHPSDTVGSKGSLPGENPPNSSSCNPRGKALLSADEDESPERGKSHTESIPLLQLRRPASSVNTKDNNARLGAPEKSGRRLLPTLSPSALRGRAATDIPRSRRSAVIPGQEDTRSTELSTSLSEGNISQPGKFLSPEEQYVRKDPLSSDSLACNGDLNDCKESTDDRDKMPRKANNSPTISPDQRNIKRSSPNLAEFQDSYRTSDGSPSNSNDQLDGRRVKILGTGIYFTEEQI